MDDKMTTQEELTTQEEMATQEELTTKERIIAESLRLFSQKGYDGVSMRTIAAAVGIKGASIYNHFSGKEDIFNAIFEKINSRYSESAMAMNIPVDNNEEAVNRYSAIGEEELTVMAEQLFGFFCQDEYTVMFRKLLTVEQHKNPMAAKIYKSYYMDAPVEYQAKLFAQMGREDAQVQAMQFYCPIYFLINEHDLGCPYEECLDKLKKHIHRFWKNGQNDMI